MPNFIKRLFKPKNEDSPRYRTEFANRIAGRQIKYVTRRIDNEDIVIGRDGCLAIHDGVFIVLASGEEKFRTNVCDLKASELMSLDGVILEGPNLEKGGEYDKVVAYYKYYR